MKTALKEILIICLLCIVIILVLGVLFYDYMPNKINLPAQISYKPDKKIEGQIEEIESSTNNASIIKSYRMDQSDIDMYESQNIYVKGKSDPFSEYKEETPDTNTTTTKSSTSSSSSNSYSSNNKENTNTTSNSGSSNNSSNNSSSSSSSDNTSSTGRLFEKPGVK